MIVKPQLYVHIGTHKTGSTAIQQALRQNQDILQKKEIIFLPAPSNIKPLMTCEALNKDLIKSFKQYLDNQVSFHQKNQDVTRYLMSWEEFSGDPLSGYKNVDLVARHLQEITIDIDVRIIVYLRSQDDFSESLYTQKIHEGESYTFQSFIEPFSASSFNCDLLLQSYADCFGKDNITVRRYDKTFLPEPTSLLHDFFQIIDIDENLRSSNRDIMPNRMYSRDALEIARISNPHLNADEKKYLVKIEQKVMGLLARSSWLKSKLRKLGLKLRIWANTLRFYYGENYCDFLY